MKKALEACDMTEALIENTGYIWTRMDTEAPEIISEYWTLTLDGENKTKQKKKLLGLFDTGTKKQLT